jgi:hypothetical protein
MNRSNRGAKAKNAVDASPLDEFLAQPDYVEDEEMETAHIRSDELHGEQRLRFAIARLMGSFSGRR